ncbi:MAG: (Fe-S)-binding protein [Archaeoglobaceae archaeon]|nr:(Fe-S)-binding protein [Archaeoglobaceae archaeon]MDW8118029.1 (Fe-S)-binding protein [Archaeoglobaceae archaeon]
MNPRFIMRIIEKTDLKTKLRLAKVITKLGSGDDVVKCMLCPNMCLFACPVFDAERRLTVSPSVKSRIAYFGGEGAIYHCLPCDACKENCKMEISVNETLREFRNGKYVDKIDSWISKIQRRLDEREGKILYFPGCRTFEARLFEPTVRALENADVDFAVTSELVCCGMPYYEIGNKKASEFFSRLKKIALGFEGVISNCPHCIFIMQKLGIRAEHIISYLKPKKIGGSISYHDPCIMARKLNLVEEPRKFLNACGLEILETAFSGIKTSCCGYGGIYRILYPENAEIVAKRRRKQFEAEIITACPACKIALKGKDLVELILEVV